jgi:hypothetical protein
MGEGQVIKDLFVNLDQVMRGKAIRIINSSQAMSLSWKKSQ